VQVTGPLLNDRFEQLVDLDRRHSLLSLGQDAVIIGTDVTKLKTATEITRIVDGRPRRPTGDNARQELESPQRGVVIIH
jgi:hypothetical protein